MPVPDTYKFNGQEFKINVKGTEEVPLEWGGKLVFINSVVGGAIDTRFMPAILKGIMSRMEQGPLTGSYAMPSVKHSRMQVRRFWNLFMMLKYSFQVIRWAM